jgi:energy-coupling factor transporter ATP-binding protein EcfA2
MEMELELEEAVKQIIKWTEENKSLNIFVFGKTGAGKSSLVNTLLGTERAEEGASIFSQTKGVASYIDPRGEVRMYLYPMHVAINDVDVTIWDSPGLRDPFADDKRTIEEIKKTCKSIDLFIYCTPFNQTRIGQDDFDSILALSNGLGNDIWDKALIALTFANKVNLPQMLHPGSTAEQKFDERVSDWKKALRCAITKAGVEKEVVEGIPIVPASYRDIPIPGSRQKDWFSVFWTGCLKRTRFSSLPALLKIQKKKTHLMIKATIVLKDLFITMEFNADLQKQLRTGSEQEVKDLHKLSTALKRDPAYFVDVLVRELGIDPSALALTQVVAARCSAN